MLRVLYLEDSPKDIEIIRELLIDAGYDLTMDCTAEEEEFISLLRSRTYDIILSDFKLPGFDGFTALRLANEICPKIPFICVSGTIGEEAAVELLKQGAVDYILKDRLSKLPSAINRALGEAREKETRQQVEAAMRESELKLRTVANYTNDWEYWEKENREIAYISPSCERITGYSPHEFMADSALFEKIVHPEDVDQVRQANERVFTTENKHDVDELEFRIIHKNGSVVHIYHVCRPIFDASDQYHGRRISNRDITKRKRAEEELKKSEDKFRTIFDNTSDGMFLVDLNARKFFMCNATCMKMLGYTQDEFLALDIADIHPGEDMHFINEQIGKYCKGEEGIRSDIRFKRKDGSIFAADLRPGLLTIGEKKYLLINFHDITERKQTEAAIKESEERYNALFERSLDLVYVCDFEGNFIDANDAALNLLGYKKEEIGSLNFAALLSEDQLPLAFKVIQEIRETGIQKDLVEFRLRSKNGKEVYVESKGSAIMSNGITVAIQSIARDITKRKQMEEALNQSNTFNTLLVQTMPFGIDIVDEKGNILFMNGTMKKIVGVDIIGRKCWVSYKDDVQQCQYCPLKHEINFETPEIIESAGALGGKTYQISHIGMMYEGKKALLEVFQDITRQKLLQSQFLQTQKVQSIGTLAGGIAHDFNNILGIILAYTSILERSGADEEKISKSTSAITQAVGRGAALVRQILTFARQTGVLVKPLIIPDLIRELVVMLQETFPEVIEFKMTIEKNIPFVNADQAQMHQVLLNLFVNARDAMPKGGIIGIEVKTVTAETLIQQFPKTESDHYVSINVSDTGIGMDEATRSRIFDPFFTTKEQGKGTGLGLSVVYGVIQEHHGFISVESKVGQGTTFHLYLPVPPEEKKNQDVQKIRIEETQGGSETILFIEDEQLLRDVVQSTLESNGYKVLIATNGREAVEIYKKQHEIIALVLSDMGLPKLKGIDVYAMLKEINPNVKVIFASGFISLETRSGLLKEGAKGFIQKPYNLNEVLQMVREVLNEKENNEL